MIIKSKLSKLGLIPPTGHAIQQQFHQPILSPDEADFNNAIYEGLVYPAFQPIVDRNLKVVGFEILCRWKRNGKEWQPAEFLPLLHSKYIWMLLTSFVVNTAITCINKFSGRLYFSVNIPPSVAEDITLVHLMDTARKRLLDTKWESCLLMELSEDTDLSYNAKAAMVLQSLNKKGYQILLDDCFSNESVIFPIRQVQFSGYKLDMSIVEQMTIDENERMLIEVLVYYCRLTGKYCIAEGVDSAEKLSLLKSIGVEYFQGYMISRPVLSEDLEIIVHQQGIP